MERQADHWLYRLLPEEWLRAARNELVRAKRALLQGDRRKGLFEARRAAGMALNAWLHIEPREAYGRSYLDHLRALANDASVPPQVRRAAQALLEKPPPAELDLVGLRGLSRPAQDDPAHRAEEILEYVGELVDSRR